MRFCGERNRSRSLGAAGGWRAQQAFGPPGVRDRVVNLVLSALQCYLPDPFLCFLESYFFFVSPSKSGLEANFLQLPQSRFLKVWGGSPQVRLIWIKGLSGMMETRARAFPSFPLHLPLAGASLIQCSAGSTSPGTWAVRGETPSWLGHPEV